MSLSSHATGSSAQGSVLVTGANGFIGRRIVRALAESGQTVIAVVRSPERIPLNRFATTFAPSHATHFVECDLLDLTAITHFIAAHRPRACVHAAWDVSGPNYLDDTNNQRWVQAGLHLARCLMLNGCKWMGVCGTHVEPSGKKHRPPNRYAAAKSTLRHRLLELAGDRMNVCWWRIFQPYGEGERGDRFVPSLLHALAGGERFLVRQPEALRDFIHVDDVARAIALACQREIGGVFDVGAGRLHRLADVARMAARMNAAEHLLDFDQQSATTAERSVAADIEPLACLTGWKPLIDLERGLHDLVHEHRTPLRASA